MLRILPAFVTAVAVLCANGASAATKGSVYFYTEADFRGTLFPVDISKSNKCYSLCEFKTASSVQWLGRFPVKGYTFGKAHIAFYTEKTCIGPHVHFPIDFKNQDADSLVNASRSDLSRYDI
jgi:hypothetical protein